MLQHRKKEVKKRRKKSRNSNILHTRQMPSPFCVKKARKKATKARARQHLLYHKPHQRKRLKINQIGAACEGTRRSSRHVSPVSKPVVALNAVQYTPVVGFFINRTERKNNNNKIPPRLPISTGEVMDTELAAHPLPLLQNTFPPRDRHHRLPHQ